MNAPAKRFSLTKLMTSVPAEARPVTPTGASELRTVAASPAPAPAREAVAPAPLEPAALSLSIPISASMAEPLAAAKSKPAPKGEVRESHPKKKRSYSVDMKVCEDLEVLTWYQGRSSSSVVEELVRKYLSQNRALLIKAQDIRNAR